MTFSPDSLTLYAITDNGCLRGRDLAEQVELALQGGVTCLQLRDKSLSTQQLAEEGAKLLKICRKYGVPLIINDDPQAALLCGADGVHVGAEDISPAEVRRMAGRDFIIGVTAKTIEQALAAEKAGADYLGVGAVFPSPTKKNALRITPEMLREITASVTIPTVAIGGISADNISAIYGCGQKGIAVVSAVFAPDDVKAAAETMRRKAEEAITL